MQKMGLQTHLEWGLGEDSLDGWTECGKGFLRGEIFELSPET